MALSLEQQTALANEARRSELKRREARLVGQLDAGGLLAQAVAQINSDASRALESARAEIVQLEQGAGPGLSEDFGAISTVEQAARAERFAGKAAAIDFIQANPACLEADAVAAYESAAQAARPGEPLIHSAQGLLKKYARNAVDLGLIADDSWATFRDFVAATPKADLLAL